MIWAMAAAALGWAAADPAALTVSNPRVTYGLQGPVRADDKVLPGDTVYLCFDLAGLKADDDGTMHYSTALEFADAKGKVVFKAEPRNQDAVASLGGDRVPAYARIDAGTETPPGEYTVKATVKDLSADKSQAVTHTFRVLPKDFGVVGVKTTSDQEGLLFVSVPGCGEGLWVHFDAVGFARGPGKQPDVKFEVRVLDEAGKPVRAKALASQVSKDVPENAALLPMQVMLTLNRPGKFTVELTAADAVANKTAKVSFPLTVQEPAK
jgi:hypothetical protein